MPAAKTKSAAKKAAKQKSFEETLWDTANKLRGSVESSEWSEAKDNMIALPSHFYTVQIPVCLWFLTKNKKADRERDYRNREGETLFIDARKIGSMIKDSLTQQGFFPHDIAA